MGNSFKDFLAIQISQKTKKRLSKSTINNYSTTIRNISELYIEKKIVSKDIKKMGYQEFLGAFQEIEKSDLYEERNEKHNNVDSATLNHYKSYLKLLDSNPNIDFDDITDNSEEIEPEEMVVTKAKQFVLSEAFNKNKNYCYSLLAKPFVILAGNSGTGKSKISIDFADWLGKTNSEDEIYNKLVVPVGADWTDNTKILGFYNPIENTYESTKILDFILLAEEYPEIPFFLILDEMNLSHVERYFSDLLSTMESKEPIVLYSKEDKCKSSVPEIIKIPNNLFITGTVNIDETTYMFSPKVLDRANVIEFIPSFEDILKNFEKDLSPEKIKPINDGTSEGFLELANIVRSSVSLPENAKKATEILAGILKILKNSTFEFAFRTTKEIRLYLNAASKLSENEGKVLEEEDFINLMDEQLLQKILPKIHGNRNQIGDLLNNLSNYCDNKSVEIEGESISGFNLPLSKKKLDGMIKQLETAQFASFI